MLLMISYKKTATFVTRFEIFDFSVVLFIYWYKIGTTHNIPDKLTVSQNISFSSVHPEVSQTYLMW